MITLNELHIKTRFKNLEDLYIDFKKNDAVTVFIGNNGSGKSNIIEALSSIFAGLYNNELNPEFSYELKYKKDNNDILITYNHTSTRNKYTFNNIPEGNYLPNQIICLYSGEESRLWNRYYLNFYEDYYKNVISSKVPISENIKMLFINKYHWDIALLTMLQSDLEVNDILGNNEISTIDFYFDKKSIENVKRFNEKNPNEVTHFVNKILNTKIGNIESFNGMTGVEFPIELFKKEFVQTHTEFFKLLSVALLPREPSWKLITKIGLWFKGSYSLIELSEGEKKLLLVKFITRILSDNNSIFFLDEPDAHIHIANKISIKNLLYDLDKNVYVESIITTHSPTLTSCFKDENLFMLDKGKLVEKQKHEIIQSLTGEFWNSQQQNIFLSSEKPIILLVEGKHDKEHISNAYNKLKDEYPELSFDIFYMNSACNIPHLLTGLRTSEIDYDKIIIGIFDYDQTGKVELSNTTCKFPDVQNSKRHKEGYFAISYPKHAEHKSEIFTVENFFDSNHLETAFNSALSEFAGKFAGKSIESISEDVKDKAKSKLFENSKTFTNKEDFKHFRKLFDIIKEIKKYNDDNKVAVTSIKPTKISSSSVSPVVPSPSLKISAKDNHLAYWTAFKKFIDQQKVSFKVQKPQAQHWTNITIGKSDFRLVLIANTQKKSISVFLVCLGKNSFSNFHNLRVNYREDSRTNLNSNLMWHENTGKKEHHIFLTFSNHDPFDKDDWQNQHQILTEWTEKFYNYFKDKINIIANNPPLEYKGNTF